SDAETAGNAGGVAGVVFPEIVHAPPPGRGGAPLFRVLDGDGPRKKARQRQTKTFQKGYNHTLIYLNATTSAVTTVFARASGKSTFQPNCMIWSYRSRGNVPLSQMKKNTSTHTLIKNHKGPRPATVGN